MKGHLQTSESPRYENVSENSLMSPGTPLGPVAPIPPSTPSLPPGPVEPVVHHADTLINKHILLYLTK